VIGSRTTQRKRIHLSELIKDTEEEKENNI